MSAKRNNKNNSGGVSDGRDVQKVFEEATDELKALWRRQMADSGKFVARQAYYSKFPARERPKATKEVVKKMSWYKRFRKWLQKKLA